MKLVVINILFIITISCGTSKKENTSINDNKNVDNHLEKEEEFELIFSSEYGGNDTFSHLVINTSTDLKKELERLNISNELSDLNNFDFDKNAILFLHLGQKNTGGYAISIDKIEWINDEIVIYSNWIAPEKGENVTMALTNPFSVYRIPKAKKYSIK